MLGIKEEFQARLWKVLRQDAWTEDMGMSGMAMKCRMP